MRNVARFAILLLALPALAACETQIEGSTATPMTASGSRVSVSEGSYEGPLYGGGAEVRAPEVASRPARPDPVVRARETPAPAPRRGAVPTPGPGQLMAVPMPEGIRSVAPARATPQAAPQAPSQAQALPVPPRPAPVGRVEQEALAPVPAAPPSPPRGGIAGFDPTAARRSPAPATPAVPTGSSSQLSGG